MSYSARNFSGPGAGPILRKSSGSSFLQTDIWLSFWFKYCLFNREYGISSLKDRLALSRFGEDMTACRTESTLKCRLPGSPRSTFLVAFSPDRKILASTHGDHTIRIIDGKTGCCLDTLEGHPRTPWSIAFHPSQGHLLASGCLAGEVRVWDLKRGRSTVYRSPESNAITSLAFHPTDLVLLVATGNQLLFWNLPPSTPTCKARNYAW